MAGLLSFLSPCILPIVPFYLSYMAGIGLNQITEGEAIPASVRTRAVLSSIAFSLGVITIFVGMGTAATAFGGLVNDHFDTLRWIAAAIIIVMGLHFLGVMRIPILHRQLRAEPGAEMSAGYFGAYLVGLAFAFGWTPCIGPPLAAILSMAMGAEEMGQGALLLFVYGLGMTLPFIVAAIFIRPFLAWMSGFRRHLGTVEKAMGVMLIVFGVLIATNTINYIANWMLEVAPGLWLGV